MNKKQKKLLLEKYESTSVRGTDQEKKRECEMTEMCRLCKHPKKLHTGHMHKDSSGTRMNHINCNFVVKRTEIDLGVFGITDAGHTCSCHGFKPNTYLMRGVKRCKAKLKPLDKTLVRDMYEVSDLRKEIRRLKKLIQENPKNLLWWQKEIRNECL